MPRLNESTMTKPQILHRHLRQMINIYRGKTQREMAELATEQLRIPVSYQEISNTIRGNEDLHRLRSAKSLEVQALIDANKSKSSNNGDEETPANVQQPLSVLDQMKDLQSKNESLNSEMTSLKERLNKMAAILGVPADE